MKPSGTQAGGHKGYGDVSCGGLLPSGSDGFGIDAFGPPSLNPLFSAGVLLNSNVGGRGTEHHAETGHFIRRSDGRIVDMELYRGWRAKTRTAAMTGLDLFGYEDDYEDNSNFWYMVKGTSALILFATGRSPRDVHRDRSISTSASMRKRR